MMRAMPYNLQEKGICISQISSSAPKWKSLLEEEEFKHQFQVPRATSSIESDPTSTLDTTTRRSPSTPTSTSTLSSSFTGGKNSGDGGGSIDNTPPPGVAEEWTAAEELHVSGGVGGGGGGGGIGMEEWNTMFPNGDGALLPWIMGEIDEPGLGLGLKHLLQSGNPVQYEGNAGLGVVDQLEPNLGFIGSGFGINDKIGSSISRVLDCNKVSNHGVNQTTCNPLTNLNGSIPASLQAAVGGGGGGSGGGNGGGGGGGGGGGLAFSHPQQFDVGDEKPQIFNPLLVMNPQQAQSMGNPSFLMPSLGYCQLEQHMFEPQVKRDNPGVIMDPNRVQVTKNPFLNPGHQHYPLPVYQQQHLEEQVIKDQLFKAADLIQTGNFSLAQEILARLNHQHSVPGKPVIRAALYVKEALQMLLGPLPKTLITPYDIVHKINAYKVFSEISPITQFVNFTCTQAILEAFDDSGCIHIIDFDIGCGAQWASLIQELPLRKRGASSLKITAVVPLSTTHPFELSLIRENLVQFANDIGFNFELQVVNLDLFDPSSCSIPNFRTSEDESIAVNIPISASSNRPSLLPSILRFIKQNSPEIVVSLDRGFDRYDLPFPQHLIHTLESCTTFLESLDSVNVTSDNLSKIEKFLIQPKIENTLLGRVHSPDKMPHWKNLFTSAGFLPLQFSNFTETQADYVVKRTPGRGFQVEKRQASLVLTWQRRELVATSVWRC